MGILVKDLNKWNPEHKAVVLDGQNCKWSFRCIGLPSVVKYKNRLAVFYDAPGDHSVSHMRRSIGLAFMDLPLGHSSTTIVLIPFFLTDAIPFSIPAETHTSHSCQLHALQGYQIEEMACYLRKSYAQICCHQCNIPSQLLSPPLQSSREAYIRLVRII